MGVEASAVARVVGIETTFRNLRGGRVVLLPQRVALIGQGSTASVYDTVKAQYTSALEVAQAYGFGSPLHLAALQFFPVNGDGIGGIPLTVYPLEDDGAGVVAAGDITPSGVATAAGSFRVVINNIQSEAFLIPDEAVVADIVTLITAAITATLNLPMTAVDDTTKVDLTSKWKGASANDLVVSIIGPTDIGITFAFTQPTGGATNPDIAAAIAQVGNVWETVFLNCLDIADTTTLDLYAAFGEGRWGALVKKPMMVFTGNTEAVVATAITVPDARGTDRTNVQLVAPGSDDLPFVVAARQLARIVVLANNNPPHDYGSQLATGLTPGLDGEQWTYPQRQIAVLGGSSTIEVKDGVVNLSDTVTMYHPDGDPTPAYRYVVDVVRLQNIVFNLDLIFAASDWNGAPLIPDNQATTNRAAKKPSMAKAAIAAMIDSFALAAIVSDPEAIKATITANISAENPKRLDASVQVFLSGNTNIISIDLFFGFFFGDAAIVG